MIALLVFSYIVIIFFFQVRPCGIYREEYKSCTSSELRRHQKYTLGYELDCSTWLEDAQNCDKYYFEDDMEALKKIITNEKERQRERLKGPLNNNVWEYRDSPPSDWSKPIPGWETKASYLKVMKDKPTMCSIL